MSKPLDATISQYEQMIATAQAEIENLQSQSANKRDEASSDDITHKISRLTEVIKTATLFLQDARGFAATPTA